jgi:SAM-dependent methyltransferase
VNAPQDWYRTFFSGIVLDMWTRAVPEQQTRAEADFLQTTLGVKTGGRILDVPSGNGRVSCELGVRGYRMTGVDISDEYIAEARRRAKERDLDIAWKHGDMRELPWEAEFDGAFCWGNSFGYLDDDGNSAFLHAVGKALKRGGRFALQTGTVLESLVSQYHERRWFELGDIIFLAANRYDHTRGRLETEYTFIRDGKVDRRLGCQRAYSYSELSRLFGDAGFTNLEGYNYSGSEPFKLGSPGLILVGTKA